MWYFGSLFVLLCLWLVCVPVGRVLSECSPWRMRPIARAYFSPALGLAFFILIACPFGWLFHFSPLPCSSLTVLIGAIGWWLVPRRGDVAREVAVVFGFSLLASFPVLASVWRFDAFNTFTDAFTYLEHAQWLQQHPFREPALISGSHPAFTQIALYQHMRDRMGASYLLGWAQAAGGFDWSFRVYPAILGSLLSVAGLSIAGAVHSFVRGQHVVALGIGAIAVTMPAGLRFGSVYGFLPQTAGLAMVIPALMLFAGWLFSLRGNRSSLSPKYFLAPAITLAAGTMCYFALLPFVVISLAGNVLFAAWRFGKTRWYRLAAGLGGFILVSLVLLHVEIVRAYHAIVFDIGASVGTPLGWSLIDFCGHALGIRSGPWEAEKWIPGVPWIALGLALVLFFWGLYVLSHSTQRRRMLLSLLIFIAISGTALVKFLYFTPRPAGWAVGLGASWSACKVSEWASPFFTIIWGIGLAQVLAQRWLARWVRPVGLAAVLGVTLSYNWVQADASTRQLRDAVYSNRQPFETILTLKQHLDQHERGMVLNLDFSSRDQKLRQLLIYFLRDFHLAGDWSDDVYLSPMLPTGERTVSPPHASVKRVFAVDGALSPNTQAFGRIRVGPPTEYADIGEVTADYGRESDKDVWWYWVKNEISFHCRAKHKPIDKLRITATINRVDPTYTVQCIVRLPERPALEYSLGFEAGGSILPLPLIDLPADVNEFALTFRCEGTPRRLSASDAREATFMLRNLELTLVDQP